MRPVMADDYTRPDARAAQTASSSSRLNDFDDPPAPGDSLRSAGRHLSELKAYLGHFLSAKSDAMKLSLKRVVIFIGLGLAGLVVGGAMLAAAGVLLLSGLAHAIGAIFEPD